MFDADACRAAIERTAAAVTEAPGRAVAVTHLGYGKGWIEQVASNRRVLDETGKSVMTRIAYSQGGYETGFVSRVALGVEEVLMNGIEKLLEVGR
ncbi:MAG: hypothetical protein ACYC6Y_03755 [Thermoguttaceae bacterium]